MVLAVSESDIGVLLKDGPTNENLAEIANQIKDSYNNNLPNGPAIEAVLPTLLKKYDEEKSTLLMLGIFNLDKIVLGGKAHEAGYYDETMRQDHARTIGKSMDVWLETPTARELKETKSKQCWYLEHQTQKTTET